MNFIRKLFKPSVTRAERSNPVASQFRLPDSDEWFIHGGSFVYPDWKKIDAWITESTTETEAPEYHRAAQKEWLTRIQKNAPIEIFTAESTHFTLLTELQQTGRIWVLRALENARRSILEALGPLGWEPPHGKLVVLLLPPPHYENYVTPFSGPYVGNSAGMKIVSGGFVHIAAQASLQSQGWDSLLLVTLAHELTHVALHKLKLPRWLDEALAMSFEEQLSGIRISTADRLSSSFDLIGTKPLLDAFAAWWTPPRLQGFWCGELWNSETDDNGFCYELALILFRLLRQHIGNASKGFRAFVEFANPKDAGECAAQEYLGISLGDLAERFLGPGDWTPKPQSWHQQ